MQSRYAAEFLSCCGFALVIGTLIAGMATFMWFHNERLRLLERRSQCHCMVVRTK